MCTGQAQHGLSVTWGDQRDQQLSLSGPGLVQYHTTHPEERQVHQGPWMGLSHHVTQQVVQLSTSFPTQGGGVSVPARSPQGAALLGVAPHSTCHNDTVQTGFSGRDGTRYKPKKMSSYDGKSSPKRAPSYVRIRQGKEAPVNRDHDWASLNGRLAKMESFYNSLTGSRTQTQTGNRGSPRPPQRKPGTCYLCGQTGHWRNECPAQDNQDTSGVSQSGVIVQTEMTIQT